MNEQELQESRQRDILWNESFRIFYDAYYEQLLAEHLQSRWYWVDMLSRLLVAVTASGSAIAAWTVWALSGFAVVWAIIAAVASLLSVVHSVLNVGNRLKELAENRATFLVIRGEAASLRRRMRLHTMFGVKTAAAEIDQLSRSFSEAESKVNIEDIFRRRSLEKSIQARLNVLVQDEILGDQP